MSWKHELRLGDMNTDQRLELHCRRCSHTRLLDVCEIVTDRNRHLHIDELENRLFCSECKGRGFARVSLVQVNRITAFVGGLA